jgi:hypothetical protein
MYIHHCSIIVGAETLPATQSRLDDSTVTTMEISPITLALGTRGWTDAGIGTKTVPFRHGGLLGRPEKVNRLINFLGVHEVKA